MNYFKPSRIAFYLLSILSFFFLGVLYVALTGAAKNQGLAGGAIVVGYGLMGAFIGLIASVVFVRFFTRKIIIWLNIAMLIIIVGFILYFFLKFNEREKNKTSQSDFNQPKSEYILTSSKTLAAPSQDEQLPPMGLGMVRPNFFEYKTLYFYGDLNFDKSVTDHSPYDSLVFSQSELGFEISYAPPWFVPAHLKMDYEVLFLRALSLHFEFIEVVVNETDGQTSFIDRSKANLIFWPEFLLSVNSVEPIVAEDNLVRIKPLSHASPVTVNYDFLRPIRISDQWIFVELLRDDLKPQGRGWIKWHENGQLLIQYNLFS